MVWISIEGSIGSGKTTVINKLHTNYSTNTVGIYREPVEDWGRCLDLFYSDQKRHAFIMQMRVNISFTDIYNRLQTKDMAITERSSYSSRHVFGKMLNNQFALTNIEFDLLNEMIDVTQPKTPDYFIYLKTHPNVSYNRIISRGDKPIDINYLTNLGIYHDHIFACKPNVYVIDANASEYDVYKTVIGIIRTIKSK